MEEHDSNTHCLLRGCIWCVRPVKAPVSVTQLVIFRVVAIILVFISMIGSILQLVLLPWKIEEFEGRRLYFGLWKICKATPHEKPYYDCFREFYDEEENDEVEGWFYAWRNLLVVASCLLFLSFCCLIVAVASKKKNTKYAWIIASSSSFISGGLTFSSLIIFYVNFEFGFAEPAREYLGWTEETDIEETFGYLYTVSWCIMGLLWITSYFCYYTKYLDKIFYQQSSMYRKARNVTNGSYDDDLYRAQKL